MRAILLILVLVFCASFAFAAEVPPAVPGAIPAPRTKVPVRGHALLQLSPMYIEIRDTLAVADALEKKLLADLAVATDEPTVEAIVHRLESLPLERVLSILRIEMRYARQQDRPQLEREIRLRMIEMMAEGRI